MSEKNQDKKKSTFLTGLQQQKPKQHVTNSPSSNSNSENSSSNEQDRDDDDEYYEYTDDYPNPFYQYPSQLSTTHNDATSKKIDTDSASDNRPISAIAPKIYNQDDSHVEISSTPAFQSLEEVK